MGKPKLTHSELCLGDGPGIYYWGIVTMKDGSDFYIGPFNSRSTARRRAIKRMKEMRIL